MEQRKGINIFEHTKFCTELKSTLIDVIKAVVAITFIKCALVCKHGGINAVSHSLNEASIPYNVVLLECSPRIVTPSIVAK